MGHGRNGKVVFEFCQKSFSTATSSYEFGFLHKTGLLAFYFNMKSLSSHIFF